MGTQGTYTPRKDNHDKVGMVEKKRIIVALYQRPDGYNPTGPEDLKKYHWSIIVAPKKPGGTIAAFDVSNGAQITRGWKDDGNARMANPIKDLEDPKQRGFAFQFKYGVNPVNNIQLTGRIDIGTVTTSTLDIQKTLEAVKLPSNGRSCVDWEKDAIERLQNQNGLKQIDFKRFSRQALQFSDDNLQKANDLAGNGDLIKAKKSLLTIAEYDVKANRLILKENHAQLPPKLPPKSLPKLPPKKSLSSSIAKGPSQISGTDTAIQRANRDPNRPTSRQPDRKLSWPGRKDAGDRSARAGKHSKQRWGKRFNGL